MTVVRIIADHPVLYSLNNGFTMSEFDPGEYYDVPQYVLRGMLARGWAEIIATPPGMPSHPRDQPSTPPPPPQPQPKPEPEPQPKPKPDGGDDVEEDRGQRKKAR